METEMDWLRARQMGWRMVNVTETLTGWLMAKHSARPRRLVTAMAKLKGWLTG